MKSTRTVNYREDNYEGVSKSFRTGRLKG